MTIQSPAEWKASQTAGAKPAVKANIQSPAEWLSQQPAKEPTLLQKTGEVAKELTKAVVSPILTMAARPGQALRYAQGDKTIEELNQRSKELFGDWVAPIEEGPMGVYKDVGRGIQTTLTGGLGGVGATAFKGLAPTAKLATEGLVEGLGYGLGIGMEKGEKPLSPEMGKDVALAGVLSAAAPVVLKGAGKLLGKAKKPVQEGIEKTAIVAEEKLPAMLNKLTGEKFNVISQTPEKTVLENLKTKKPVTIETPKVPTYYNSISREIADHPVLENKLTKETFDVIGDENGKYQIKSKSTGKILDVDQAGLDSFFTKLGQEVPVSAPTKALEEGAIKQVEPTVIFPENKVVSETGDNLAQIRVAQTANEIAVKNIKILENTVENQTKIVNQLKKAAEESASKISIPTESLTRQMSKQELKDFYIKKGFKQEGKQITYTPAPVKLTITPEPKGIQEVRPIEQFRQDTNRIYDQMVRENMDIEFNPISNKEQISRILDSANKNPRHIINVFRGLEQPIVGTNKVMYMSVGEHIADKLAAKGDLSFAEELSRYYSVKSRAGQVLQSAAAAPEESAVRKIFNAKEQRLKKLSDVVKKRIEKDTRDIEKRLKEFTDEMIQLKERTPDARSVMEAINKIICK